MTMAMKFDLCHVRFQGKLAAVSRRQISQSQYARISPSHSLQETVETRDDFIDWVIGRAGLDASLYRHRPLQRRLAACLRALKVRSVDDARMLLESRPDLFPAAVSSLLIGVTEFFRDPAVFERLRAEILPNLAVRRGRLRIWSAACASGEELYSLAILLAEAGLLSRSFLLGTDCRTDAVEQADRALYAPAALYLMEPGIRDKYFEPEGNFLRPIRPLRRQVHWKAADLADTIEDGTWDIILWRNLAIYLNPGPTERMWARLAGALAPNGYLIIGKAEWPPSGHGLQPVCRCIYRGGGPAATQYLHKEYA